MIPLSSRSNAGSSQSSNKFTRDRVLHQSPPYDIDDRSRKSKEESKKSDSKLSKKILVKRASLKTFQRSGQEASNPPQPPTGSSKQLQRARSNLPSDLHIKRQRVKMVSIFFIFHFSLQVLKNSKLTFYRYSQESSNPNKILKQANHQQGKLKVIGQRQGTLSLVYNLQESHLLRVS